MPGGTQAHLQPPAVGPRRSTAAFAALGRVRGSCRGQTGIDFFGVADAAAEVGRQSRGPYLRTNDGVVVANNNVNEKSDKTAALLLTSPLQ